MGAQGEISVASMASYMGVTEKSLRQFLAGQIPRFITSSSAWNVMLQNERVLDKLYIGFLGLDDLSGGNPVVSPMTYSLIYDTVNDTVLFNEY